MEENKITEQDLFGNIEEKEDIKTFSSGKSGGIPSNYIPVKFNSIGKLSTPPVLHFRNFSANESAKLAVANQEDEYRTYIDCLNSMVYESFDCSKLHVKELLTIIYTIHGSFFSDKIEKKFIIDPTLSEPELTSDDNIDTAEIRISDLKTKTLPKEFKEPITITSKDTGVSAQFVLPRIGFAVQAQDYLEEKYRKELMDFYDVKVKIESLSSIKDSEKREKEFYSISSEIRKEYESFQKKYWEEFVIIMNSLCIQKVGSKTATSVSEHIKLGNLIDTTMQKKFNDLQNDCDFGIQNDDVKYYSAKEDKFLSRRFQFRIQDFLQNSKQLETDSRFDVQFG